MPSVPSTLLYAHILVVLPILVAYYLSSRHVPSTIADIPVSKVLAQNLRMVNHSWEHGVLVHALLELQNPELTVFAGAGYGVHLRTLNPGAVIEPFPQGQLPQAGGSRYDPWLRVKGLRHAAGVVVTDGSAGPVLEDDDGVEGGGLRALFGAKRKREKERGGWLFYQEGDKSAADAASLGWATLLLERAGAADVNNPVGVGRNAYGEAADRMVEWLFDESRNARFKLDEWEGLSSANMNPSSEEEAMRTDKEQKGSEKEEMQRWAISHMYGSKQLWADSVFMVPPFLAAYAVARQDEVWLLQAVEQIKVYEYVLRKQSSLVEGQLWSHIQRQDPPSIDEVCCRDNLFWLTGNAWALAGIVRVLSVLERWHIKSHTGDLHLEGVQEKRLKARNDLLKFAQGILDELVKQGKNNETGLLKNYLDGPGHTPEWWAQAVFGDAAGSALVAGSVYRLTQLGVLNDHDMLRWADELYNAVANQISPEGIVGSVADVSEVPSLRSVPGTSEGQSMVLLMYAARRDCVKLGICEAHQDEKWWSWLYRIATIK
ncbi:hypothetical protein H2198_002561 [Neophaeococcomyces mojaviensis]|uniref:Uncharacterized protein n=1 Tax=Neophaeococcomyces mojaviensis TaxID=3383035 RepID=A0ACC3ADX8_9EURO|nr:hypothetical protein H2198_002561 [Knufia sp. JES_112]